MKKHNNYQQTSPPADLSGYIFGKVAPQAIPLEEAALGAIMLDKQAIYTCADILKPETFYLEAHQHIYRAMLRLFDRSQPIDLLTVMEELKKSGDLDAAGGPPYLAELTHRVASAANLEYHSRILAQKHIQRVLGAMGSDLIRLANDDTQDPLELIEVAEQKLYEVSTGVVTGNFKTVAKGVVTNLQRIDDIRKNPGKLRGLSYGIRDMDAITGGLIAPDLIIIAARPGMGKCLGKGTKVLMFDGSLKNVEDVVSGDQLMGDDSTPRNVLSIARGREQMYWIRQNKGIDYRVNESHILSLKKSRNDGKGLKGRIIDIPLKDYLGRSKKFQNDHKGFKVAVEFPESPLPISPYFLGVWLGDGSKDKVTIHNPDPEIVRFLDEYAKDLGLTLNTYTAEGKCPAHSITKGYKGNGFALITQIKALGIFDDKDIPQEYLINSESNRLELLAGLLDTDGYYSEQCNGYEITQKSERLARKIKFLADSLGFRTSIKSKIAKIKSIGYECEVFKVLIFGDVDKIPMKVERKRAKRAWSHNVDWRTTGIQIEKDTVDDYYGFQIDGNHRFLLEDMTVTHNTGKALTIARNVARAGYPVAFFSLEMDFLQLTARLQSMDAAMGSEVFRRPDKMNPYENDRLAKASAQTSELPIWVDDTAGINITELRVSARRAVRDGAKLIIVDYLQLMSGSPDSRGNREQEISSISRGLKKLAKELQVPIIALSQLSRAVETRGGDKRPQLSDLRESGGIEQDADIVQFIYRPEYYGILEDADGRSLKGVAEIIIAKHRNGPLDTVKVRFQESTTRFYDFDAQGMEIPPLAYDLEDAGSPFVDSAQGLSTAMKNAIKQGDEDTEFPF